MTTEIVGEKLGVYRKEKNCDTDTNYGDDETNIPVRIEHKK